MATQVERGARRTASDHIVQLFDDRESLARGVAAFLEEGVRAGDSLLVVAQPGNWCAIAARLARAGVPLDALVRERGLTVLDARVTLDALMRQGEPARSRFDDLIGDLVRRLSTRPLRVYGEMVELLAAEASFDAAERLEGFWNELGEQCTFSLLCGYSSVHFGPEKNADTLRRICRAHTRTASHDADHLGSWLLAANGLRQTPDRPQSAARAE